MNTSAATIRVQALADQLKTQLATIKTALADAVKAQTDANGRLEASISALLNNAGSGNEVALNAIADEMAATLEGYQAVATQLNAVATAEAAVDPAPAPLVIAPVTVSIVRGITQQFSVSGGTAPISFKATHGSIDGTGLYTAPTDTAITSDTVVSMSADGQSATASVLITEPAPPAVVAPPAVPATA